MRFKGAFVFSLFFNVLSKQNEICEGLLSAKRTKNPAQKPMKIERNGNEPNIKHSDRIVYTDRCGLVFFGFWTGFFGLLEYLLAPR